MNIIFVESEGQLCPRIVCDHCKEIIEDASAALVKFNEDSSQVLVVHKGECDDLSIGRSYPDKWAWQSLDVFWVYVGRNMQLDTKRAEKWADVLSNI